MLIYVLDLFDWRAEPPNPPPPPWIRNWIHFGFVFIGSLYIQVIQGFIHDDHEDLINKHVMMIRVTDDI